MSQHVTAECSCCNRGLTSDSRLPETAPALPRLGPVLGMLWLSAARPGLRLLENASTKRRAQAGLAGMAQTWCLAVGNCSRELPSCLTAAVLPETGSGTFKPRQ